MTFAPFTPLFRLRSQIAVLATVVLLLTLGFNLLLSVSTLDRLVAESLLTGFRGAAEHLGLSIERGLRFGKPLQQYAGMQEMLLDLSDGLDGLLSAGIIDGQGRELYVVHPGPNGPASSADTLASRAAFDRSVLDGQGGSDGVYWTGPSSFRLVVPLTHGSVVGGVVLDIEKSFIEATTTKFLLWSVAMLAVACVTVGLVLSGWIGLLTATEEKRSHLDRHLNILLLALIGGAQLVCSLGMLVLFQSFAAQAARETAQISAHFIKRDYEYLVYKGIDVRNIPGGRELLERIVAVHPEVSGAALVSPDGKPLATVGNAMGNDFVEDIVDAYWPSRYRQHLPALSVRLYMDSEYTWRNARTLGLDLATSLVISLIFLLELSKMLGLMSGRLLRNLDPTPAAPKTQSQNASQALRVAGFLFFIGYDMGISFIPLRAKELFEPLWGLSEEILIGLPISAEMICAGIALLGTGVLAERLGWRFVFALGSVSATIGLFLCGMADSLLWFISGRSVAGLGFGMILMAAQIGALEDKGAGSGLAGIFAGIFAGSICGSACGGLLAERIGYASVFTVAGCLTPIAVLGLLLAGKRKRVLTEATEVGAVPTDAPPSMWAFLRDSRMQALLVLIGLPAAFCLTGFLHYLLPQLLESAHVSNADIGRMFMLYGLCFITVGPALGTWLDRPGMKVRGAMLTGLLSGFSLLVASFSSSLWAAAAAVVSIGVAQCLAAPATMLCVISLASAQRLGRGRTAAVYRTLERLGQVLGPILMGAALAYFQMSQTLLALGIAACGLSLLFVVFWRLTSERG